MRIMNTWSHVGVHQYRIIDVDAAELLLQVHRGGIHWENVTPANLSMADWISLLARVSALSGPPLIQIPDDEGGL